MPDGLHRRDPSNDEPFHRAIAIATCQAIGHFQASGLRTILQIEAAFKLGSEIARLYIDSPMPDEEVAIEVMMLRARELYNPSLDPQLYDHPDAA